jgi:hypothetical protein
MSKRRAEQQPSEDVSDEEDLAGQTDSPLTIETTESSSLGLGSFLASKLAIGYLSLSTRYQRFTIFLPQVMKMM